MSDYRNDPPIPLPEFDPYEQLGKARKRIEELEALVKMSVEVVDDFMPNIGQCVLQDYGRLNEFLMTARKLVGRRE